jgi:pimeloyl-ACP methyl ester carboxylesterase
MAAQINRHDRQLVGDIELEVLHQGNGSPLLLLHGGEGLDDHAAFLQLLAMHFEVIAPSHPGFGSPLPDRFDSIDDLAYLYLDLLDSLDLHDVVLLGFSLGGWIAAEIAVRCTHRLRKLVMVGPVGIKTGDREVRELPDLFAMSPDALARLMFHDPTRAARDFSAMKDEDLGAIARNREALALYTWEPYMHNPKLRYQLGRIRVPTMIIRGASDGFVGQAYVERYAELPNARLELIPAAGHSPQIEQPEDLTQLICSFTSMT